jgi:hypothetical protein
MKRKYDVTVLTPNYYFLKMQRVNREGKLYEQRVNTMSIKGIKISLLFDFYFYFGLRGTQNHIYYLPFGIYNNIFNIIFKFNKSVFIVGSHGFLLDENKHAFSYHKHIEQLAKFLLLSYFKFRPKLIHSLYFQILNEDQKTYLIELGIPEDHIFFVPNFLDFSKFSVKENKFEKLKVLHVGGSDKAVDKLIELIKRLKDNNRSLFNRIEFHFIGKNQPKELIKMSESNNNIIVHGFVREEEKKEIMKGCDVLFLPAVESFSLTALEGFASGLICIGRPNWILRFMKTVHDDSSYYFEINNYRNFERILAYLVLLKKKKQFTKRFRISIHDATAEKFDKKEIINKLVDMFGSITKFN